MAARNSRQVLEVVAVPSTVAARVSQLAVEVVIVESAGDPVTGTGSLTSPAPSLSAAGGLPVTGAATFAAAAPSLDASGGSNIFGTAAFTAPVPALSGSGGDVASGGGGITNKTAAPHRPRITIPGPAFAAAGSIGYTGIGAFTAPAPAFAATAAGGVTGTGAFLAFVPYFDPSVGDVQARRRGHLALLGVG